MDLNQSEDSSQLNAIVQRLQNCHAWNIYTVTPDGDPIPWFQVDGSIVQELVIHEATLLYQVQTVTASIVHWGRHAALARRVWQIAERKYRCWRDGVALSLYDPEDKPSGWKRPSQAMVECMIRQMPEYTTHYKEMERAEEAYNSTNIVVDAFRAKKSLLKIFVTKKREDAAPRLNVF